MTDHDDGEDDPQLRALRAVWLSLPDEDPPERGLAELMAAARVKAEVMAHPSWWQRTIAQLRRPPVLALATLMVLLGGALFIGRRSASMKETATEQIQREPPPAPAAGSAASVATPPPADQLNFAPTPALPEQQTMPNESRDEPPPKSEVLRRKEALAPKGSTPKPAPDRPHVASPPSATKQSSRFDREEPRAEEAKPVAGGAKAGEIDTGGAGDATSPAGATSKAAAEPEASKPTAPSAQPSKNAAPPSVSQYYAQARSAALRGDCAAARTIAARIAKQDPQYYRTTVATDAAIKKCL